MYQHYIINSNSNVIMTNQTRPTAPIQLISFDHNKNVILNPEAASIISRFHCDRIAVIAVVGKYRTGKSFILNRVLLNSHKGFEVGPTINACTKGLWVWPEVVNIETSEGLVPSIVMDTEGLGSIEEGENTDTKIFLLAILLSSYLVYNSMGSIDEKAIQSLGLIANLSTVLQKANKGDQDDIIACFPSFMWLVRDFFLRLEDQNGQKISSKEYLENALRAQKGRTQTVENKNKIRSQLREYFKERDCCTLVRPTTYDNDLRVLNTLPQSKLRPEFCGQIQQFKSKLSNAVKPKSFQGKYCTPHAFIQMCKGFVEAINAGGVPSISSNWESVCNSQSDRIIQEMEYRHETEISCLLAQGKALTEVETTHKCLVQEGYRRIEATFLGVIEKEQKKKKLKKKLKQAFLSVRQDQTSRQSNSLKGLIEQAFIEVLLEIRVNRFQTFEEVLQKFQTIGVDSTCNQPEMIKELYFKLKNISVEYIRCLEDKWKTENLLLREKEEWMEKDYAEKRLELQRELEGMYQRQRRDEMEKYKLRCGLEDQRERVQNLEEELEEERTGKAVAREEMVVASERHDQDLALLKEEMRGRVRELTIALNCKNIDYEQLLASTSLKIESMRAESQRLTNFQKTIDDLRSKVSALEEEKEALEDSLRSDHRDHREQVPSEKQLNLRLRILQKQKQCLLKQLQNQKGISQSLMKTLQSNPSFVLINQIDTLQKESCELKQQIKSLKQYERVLLCCDILKCRLCEKSYSFGQFRNHLFLCNTPLEYDVSYEIDSETLSVVFVIEVSKGNHMWKLRKGIRNILCFLKALKQEEYQPFKAEQENIQGFESRRVLLDQVLARTIREEAANGVVIEFLGLDIHSRRADQLDMSSIEDNCLRENNSKTICCEQVSDENVLDNTVDLKKAPLLNTCKFSSNRGFIFPADI